jgi:predicted TIM-barrel fold metal-dependent hydrolase
MIIDINNTIGKRRLRPEVQASTLVKAMDQAGVDKAVAFCFAPVMDNESVLKAMKEYPHRLIGLYTANPWNEQAVDSFRRGLDDGFQGLRLDPVRHGYAANELDLLAPLLEASLKAGKPVWIYGAAEVFSSPILFQELAECFPSLPIVMGHMGYSYEATSAMGVAQRNKNVYLDITGNMFANIERVVKAVPIDQILFGTGTPDFGTFESEMQKVKDATDNLEYQRMILGENAARLYGIKA